MDADNVDKGKNLVQLTTSLGADYSPSWHPDGKYHRVCFIRRQGIGQPLRHWSSCGDRYERWRHPDSLPKISIATYRASNILKTENMSTSGLEDSGENHIACVSRPGGGRNHPAYRRPRQCLGDYELARRWHVGRTDQQTQPARRALHHRPAGTSPTDPCQRGTCSAQIKLGETEEIHCKSHDGLEIEGFITKPPSFNPAFPLPHPFAHPRRPRQRNITMVFPSTLSSSRRTVTSSFALIRAAPPAMARIFALRLYKG